MPTHSRSSRFCVFFLVLAFAGASQAIAASSSEQVKSRAEAERLIASLHYQQGTVPLQSGVASLTVGNNMRYLNPQDARTVLVKLWGNPGSMQDPLGMLVPADCNLLADCWAVIITYEESGYVKDDDAEKIDYPKLLTQMKTDVTNANSERSKEGYSTMELVGWATPPRYDRATHKLYWAKEIKFSDSAANTLNYNIRMLGRKGVLVLNAVASADQLSAIESATPELLSSIDFTSGNRYADFNPASGDKVATYGIAALIAGGVAVKAGLFKALWLSILAAKKFIILAIAAVGTWLRKTFGKKKAGPPPTDSGSQPPATDTSE